MSRALVLLNVNIKTSQDSKEIKNKLISKVIISKIVDGRLQLLFRTHRCTYETLFININNFLVLIEAYRTYIC